MNASVVAPKQEPGPKKKAKKKAKAKAKAKGKASASIAVNDDDEFGCWNSQASSGYKASRFVDNKYNKLSSLFMLALARCIAWLGCYVLYHFIAYQNGSFS